MLAPGVVVCERRGRYAARLRRELAVRGMHVRVSETRSSKDCLTALCGRRYSAVAVEMMPNPIAALDLIEKVRAFDSSLLVTAVLDRASQWLEPHAREFGAAYCAIDPFEMDLLVELILRHMQRQLRELGPAPNHRLASQTA